MRRPARRVPGMTGPVRWLAVLVIGLAVPCAHAGANRVIVDSAGFVGLDVSLRLDGGNPVISHRDVLKQALRLATCTAGCQSANPTWALTTVDSGGDLGYHTSLQLDGGKPVISYFDQTNFRLKLATCTANCKSATPTWVITTVDGGSNVGRFTSMQLNGGKPVISYEDRGNGDLKLATCTANCQSATPTWVIVAVDGAESGFRGSSLQINGGNPVISYYRPDTADLKLATCTANCQSATPTWVITTVDSGGSVGGRSSLQLNGGNPVISYQDGTNHALKLATCTANCQSASPTWVVTTVDIDGNLGEYNSLQLDGDKPVIAFFDVAHVALKLATCTANCRSTTPTWVVSTIDSDGNQGQFASLQLNGGNPVIGYFDSTDADLKLATITPPTVVSITRTAANPTAAATVGFTVTFSESVTGVDAADFALATTGLTGALITGVVGAGAARTITVATGTGTGTLRLEIVDDDSIAGLIPLGGLGAGNGSFTTGETYTVHKPVFTGPSATGTGTITASFTGGGDACSFSVARFIGAPPGAPPIPPASPGPDIRFPHGLFDFSATGCTPGATLTFMLAYPSSIEGATYWKYGPTAADRTPHWYVLPATIMGNTVTFTIADGGLGDDDHAANGAIVDQGGPGVGVLAVAVPTLGEWGLLLLALMVFASAAWTMQVRFR
jgi:hypothetical protein